MFPCHPNDCHNVPLDQVLFPGGSAGNRSGFEKLPESDPASAVSLSAAQSAARKSRRHKNIIAIKIGLVILSLSAILAGLAAFFLSRGSSNTNITHIKLDTNVSIKPMNAIDRSSESEPPPLAVYLISYKNIYTLYLYKMNLNPV